jgi:tetratricopeptide (TPR) repeat protein
LNNASCFYSDLARLEETKEARKEKLDIAVEYIEEAIGIRRELGLKADVAMSLNNASNRYSDLAGLEETKEARKEKLDIAVEYIEEAIGIRRELGLKAGVAMSLNNASCFYSDLARLEETKEARKEKLDIAVEYIEEAIGIQFHETLFEIDSEERHKQKIEFYKSIRS